MKVLTNEPDPKVVQMLEETLARAKVGEILSIAIVYVDDSTNLARILDHARPRDRLTLVGALDVCQDRIKARLKITEK